MFLIFFSTEGVMSGIPIYNSPENLIFQEIPNEPPFKINTARALLSKLRNGDYAHAGDRESIDMVIQKVLERSPEIINGYSLDVGSGFGGTANDFYRYGFHNIYGIDIDEASVYYANKNYPHIKFLKTEASNVTSLFEAELFSFIYFFNVMYAIEDKKNTLKSLNAIAKPGATLMIFDYIDKGNDFLLTDLAGNPMYPINLKAFQEDLIGSGWEMLEVIDLSDKYIIWYENLLDKLFQERVSLAQNFSKEDIERVEFTFNRILKWLKEASLGGILIFAKKQLI